MKLDAFHQGLCDMFVENLKAERDGKPEPHDDAKIDAILNRCADIEYCEQCAYIFCPHGEQLHFHHDGCPACDMLAGQEYQMMLRHRGDILLRRLTGAVG